MNTANSPQIIVMGTSLGGFEALIQVLTPLPSDFPVPLLIVRHQGAQADDYVVASLESQCQLSVRYAEHAHRPQPGNVYLAPPDHHMRIDTQGNIALSRDKKINFSRPAIDPLFISAAEYYQQQVLAVLLTGANDDGANGVRVVQAQGGVVLIQDPRSAQAQAMPNAGIAAVEPNHVVWLDQIGPMLWDLLCGKALQQ